MRKIAELPTDEGLDVLVEITPYVRTLASCESLIDEFKAIANMTEDERGKPDFSANVLARIIPVWFKECRADLLKIVQIVNGSGDEEMSRLGAMRAFEEVGLLFNDPDFLSFFRSFVVMAPTE